MKVEDFLQMPDEVLMYFGDRVYQTPVQQAFRAYVFEHPDRFSQKVLDRTSNHSGWSRQDLEKHWSRQSVLRSGETLDAVFDVKDRLAALETVVRDGAQKRKGFFGG